MGFPQTYATHLFRHQAPALGAQNTLWNRWKLILELPGCDFKKSATFGMIFCGNWEAFGLHFGPHAALPPLALCARYAEQDEQHHARPGNIRKGSAAMA